MALENFYTWTVSDTDYTTVPANYTVLVENRPTYVGGFGGIYKVWPYNTFKDYVFDFDFNLYAYDENSPLWLFDISGRDNTGGYNSFACQLRFVSGECRFKLQYSNSMSYYYVASYDFSIPLTYLMYFRIIKSDDYFHLYVYEDSGRNTLLGSGYLFNWTISNFDEHAIRLANNNVEGALPPVRYLTFEINNFNIVSTSSSSSFSSSSSSRSSSSSSSYSIDPVAVINDIGVKDGSYSSSSSSTILCQLVGEDDDWDPEIVSGNPAASWNETYQRWDSVSLYGSYQYLGLDSITEIVDLEWLGYNVISSSYWVFNYGSYNAGSQRIEPGYLGYAWYAALDKQSFWASGYSPNLVEITIQFPGSSGTVEIWGPGISGTQYTTPTSNVSFQIPMSGVALDTLSFYCETVNFYITQITFAEGTRAGWPIDYTPNELKFTPTLIGQQSGIFSSVMVQLDNGTYVVNQNNVAFTSGSELSIMLNLFYDPRYIANFTAYIDNLTSNFYIEDLQFCGSASSSSSSYSSSSRSSSSSSSSNGAILDFYELVPAKILSFQENGPIPSPSVGHVNYKGNTMRFLNIYDEYLYYQEYKDGQWSPQEEIYDPVADSVRGSRPMYLHYTGPFLTDFDDRPAVVAVYTEKDVNNSGIDIFDFNYKDVNGVWQRERMSDDFGLSYSLNLIPPGANYANSVNAIAISNDNTYLAVSWSSSYQYLYIYKRSGDTFTKLTVSAPDVMPTFSLYVTCLEFSPDGTYLACGMSATPYIYLYKRVGDTFIKQTNPTNLPASTATCINWSSDSAFLCVSHNTSPKITIYSRSGDTFTKTSNPGTLPSGTPNIALFSPDTNYLAVSQTSSPYIYCYSRSGSTFTLVSNTSDLGGYAYSMTWAADSSYLLTLRNYSSFDEQFKLYTNSGGTLTASAIPYATLFDIKPRVGNERYPSWIKITEDGSLLLIGMSSAPGMIAYSIGAGPAFTYNQAFNFDLYTGPDNKNRLSVTSDGNHFAAVISNSALVFDKSGGTFVQATKNGVLSKSSLQSYVATNNGPILIQQHPSTGDVHMIIQDSPRFMHAVRNYGTGNWSYSFITPTFEVPFWEYGPGNYGEKTMGVMDSNGYLHFVYHRYYYEMPTVGSTTVKHYKLMYATNRTGSWVSSEIYNCFVAQYTTVQYWFPAIDVDTDGTIYVLGTKLDTDGSTLQGVMCKLTPGGAWQTNVLTSWNSSWYEFKGAVFDYFYVWGYYKFYAFDKTTLALAYSYDVSQIQTDPYTTGTVMNEGEDGRFISWKNIDGSDIRMRALYPNPYYYEKLYVAEFSNSSSSRSSSSRSSSSSSSSSLASEGNLWTHDLSSFTGQTALVEIIKDPTTSALHAMTSTSTSSGYWYKKASPTSGSWTIEGNACALASTSNFHQQKMFIRSTDNMRFFFYSTSNYMYYKTRADGGATWSSNTVVVPYVDAYHYPRCFDVVEDSSGYLHILYVEELSSSIGSMFPYTHSLIHRHNTSGSWASETLWTTTASYSSNSGAPQCLAAQILPGNVIHLFFILYNHGIVYSTGFTGSWTTDWFIEDRNYTNNGAVRLVKDTNNNLHMACVYRSGHYYQMASADYAFYNGLTWSKEEEITRNVAVPGYFNLITDINNNPHFIFLNGNKSNKMEEWMKYNGYWNYVTTEEYTFSTSFEFTGVYVDGYLNTFGRSSTGVPIYSQRYIASEGT